jgi:hypothetical protein
MDFVIGLIVLVIVLACVHWLLTISVGRVAGCPPWLCGAITLLIALLLIYGTGGGYFPFFRHRYWH